MDKSLIALGLAATFVAAGCRGSEEPAPTPPQGRIQGRQELRLGAEAGLPVTPNTDPSQFTALVASRANSFGRPRNDAFALRRLEAAYDQQQMVERVFNEGGGFGESFYQEPPRVVAAPVVTEPQPYRRLSGIVVGDSVVALIEMEGGRTELIRPGQRIPNSEWTVASIDGEKAILRRGGNKLPKEIRVRLESPPAGLGGGGGANPGGGPGGGPGGPGGPSGGDPGGDPGGFGDER